MAQDRRGKGFARKRAHKQREGDAMQRRVAPSADAETCELTALPLAAGANPETLALDAASWEPPVAFHDFDLPPFPVALLPDWLRAFVEAEALATQTPCDLAAMLCLSALAAVSAKKFRVFVRDGHTEPLNLFTVVALPPGNRKSAVFNDVVAPLEGHEELESVRLRPEIAEAQTRYGIAEKRLENARTEAAK